MEGRMLLGVGTPFQEGVPGQGSQACKGLAHLRLAWQFRV